MKSPNKTTVTFAQFCALVEQGWIEKYGLRKVWKLRIWEKRLAKLDYDNGLTVTGHLRKRAWVD